MDGIQPWSEGDFHPWTFPVVISGDVGYIRAIHPDGRMSPKFPYAPGRRVSFNHAHRLAEDWVSSQGEWIARLVQ